MSHSLDPALATPGDWHVVPSKQTMFGGAVMPTFAIVATGDCEQFVGRAHPINGEPADRAAVQMNARLMAASKAMVRLLARAVAYEAEAFRDDEPVDGGDLVSFFSAWRSDVLSLLDAELS